LDAINPATLPLVDGLDAFCFLGFSAFGLRVSRFVFFWLFAIYSLLGLRSECWRGDNWASLRNIAKLAIKRRTPDL
jgi:hypothetical protein